MSFEQPKHDVVGDPLAVRAERRRGRGTRSNHAGRFEQQTTEAVDDGWESLGLLERFATEVREETARTIITRNTSPDISFDRSINPYRGCEHGCVYCYARPNHCYMGHSAGLDFETKLYAKTNAATALETELSHRNYTPATVALGAVTDPYQPIERQHRITRDILEVLSATGHPVGIVTKSALVTRDIDILADMARRNLAKVAISITTLDRKLARSMEPRAAIPAKRLDAVRQLTDAGIPVGVMMAPIIPGLNDAEIETLLAEACQAGATEAGYVMLRLPIELKELFREWLATDHPDRAKRILGHLRDMHGGADYCSEFGLRQRGTGPYAAQIAARFKLAVRRLGLNADRRKLTTQHFIKPVRRGGQMSLI